MKILFINSVCGIGSTGRICTDLAQEYEAKGWEVKIAYGRNAFVPEKYQKYAVRIGTDFDVKMHVVKARLLDGSGFGSKKATEKFIDWVRDYNPDVIHLHNIHGYYINIEVLLNYLRTCGKKIIWTLHDCWAFTGHTAYCDVVGCERWITGCHDCPCLKQYPASFIDRSKENWKKKKLIMDCIPNLTVVTPSEWLAGLVRKSFLAQYPVMVIHNGIDTSQFYPMESDFKVQYGIENKKMLLGVATSWDDMKGYSDFLRLADTLDEEYAVVLVGLTKKQIKRLPKNIIGVERTNTVKELAQIYSAADLFLNLSYCENYPTVNLEAIACGTPVITYMTGGSPETLLGSCGMTVPKGDISKIVEMLRTGINNDVDFDKSRIDNINCYAKYITIYNSVC